MKKSEELKRIRQEEKEKIEDALFEDFKNQLRVINKYYSK